jgi:hypothetical protein
MRYSRVKAYTTRKGKKIRPHKRKYRGLGKKRIVGKTPVKLYPVYDEYRQFRGWKRK